MSAHKLLTAADEVALAKRIERGDPVAKRRRSSRTSSSSRSRRLSGPGCSVPRPDPGGHAGPEPRGREVRLAARFSRPTRPGGSASRCSAPSRTTRARSAFRCTWSSASRSCRAARRLEVELGREATKDELAEATGLPIQHVDEALGAAHASVSLNQNVGADDEGELGDLFADRDASDPFDEAEESSAARASGARRAPRARAAHPRASLRLRRRALDARGDRPRARPHPRARPAAGGQALSRLAAVRDLASLAA